MVVEDHALLAMEMQHWLETLGHEVIGPLRTAAGARTLLESDVQPDLALLDINLGEGGSGFDVAEVLAEQDVPFIFCTGNDCIRDERFADRPALFKPFGHQELGRAIESTAATSGGRYDVDDDGHDDADGA